MNVKDMVTENKQVRFLRYRDRELWYATECGFEFPVPLQEVGNATMLASDKAIFFMRYIRKHADMLTRARAAIHAGTVC